MNCALTTMYLDISWVDLLFILAAAFGAAGLLLHTLHGLHSAFTISKIHATLPWGLLSAALTTAAWAAVFVIAVEAGPTELAVHQHEQFAAVRVHLDHGAGLAWAFRDAPDDEFGRRWFGAARAEANGHWKRILILAAGRLPG